MKDKEQLILSLIICSRNDNYMGDPMWRLATTIEYASYHIHSLGREDQVELVVADWGSEDPIAQVIELSEKAAAIVRFIQIPPQLTKELQKDSQFGEVYALNVAARHSHGLYIGRIDQDTLVTKDFFKCFFDMNEGKRDFGFDLQNSYMFAARKQLPYSFVAGKPSLNALEDWIDSFGKFTFSEELGFCHWASPVGILMMHRDMWYDLGGYDERLIYYWFMDVDLGTRLIRKYPIVNIGKSFGYHFFHLEHINSGFKFRHSHRKLNPEWSKSFDKPVLNPNGPDWGLANYELEESRVGNTRTQPLPDESVAKKQSNSFTLFLKVVTISFRRWTYYQLKHGWYLLKRLRGKPYL